MAKSEKKLYGNLGYSLETLHNAVMSKSTAASYEDGSDYVSGDFRCAVRVYERYSWSGGNRVSMSMTLAGRDGEYFLSVITSGGSQAMFTKINTLGEDAFLETIVDTTESM